MKVICLIVLLFCALVRSQYLYTSLYDENFKEEFTSEIPSVIKSEKYQQYGSNPLSVHGEQSKVPTTNAVSGQYPLISQESYPLRFYDGECRPVGECAEVKIAGRWRNVPWDVPSFCVTSNRPYFDRTCMNMLQYYALEDTGVVRYSHRAYPANWPLLLASVFEGFMGSENQRYCQRPPLGSTPWARICRKNDTLIISRNGLGVTHLE